MRREFSTKVRVAAFVRAKGHCEKCTARLYPAQYAFDHVIPASFGGEPTLENCAVLCRNCHSEKTGTSDMPRLAKAKRQQAKHLGANPKRPWPKRSFR